jgi:hypothetical protein
LILSSLILLEDCVTLIVMRTGGSRDIKMNATPTMVLSELTDPAQLAMALRRRERADRNSAWLQAHVPEIYSQHRGKCICVAGEELFVADTACEVMSMAKAAHPDDDGSILRYIPREKLERIYANSRNLAPL